MRSVHVGIRHQDDLVVAQLRNVKIVMDPRSKGSDHSLDLRVGVNLVKPCLLHIQDLSAQGKDGLSRPGAGLLRGASGGVSLHDIDLAVLRILVRAVCQLAGQGHTVEGRLSSGQVPGLSGCLPCPLGQNGFFQDHLGYRRILLQENHQLLGNHVVHGSPSLAVAKLLLSLSLELGLRDLDADDRSQTLPDIVSVQAGLAVF